MNRVSARFGMEVSTSGSSHSNEAACSLRAEFLAPETGIFPSSGPLPRIESLSMTNGYGAESARHKARNGLILGPFGLSGGIRAIYAAGRLAAFQIGPQRLGQPLGFSLVRCEWFS